MNIPYYLIIGLQLITVVHAVKNGKTNPWLYIILFLPLVGCLAYLYLEVIAQHNFNVKGFFGSIMAQFADPRKQIAALEEELKYVDTAANRNALAELYLQIGNSHKAVELFQSSLKGLHANDPVIRGKLAEVYLQRKEFEKALEQYENIKNYRRGKLEPAELFHYAVCLDELDKPEAEKTYQDVLVYYSSLEGDYRYLSFLKRHNLTDKIPAQVAASKRKFASMHPKFKREAKVWMKKIDTEIHG